MQNRFQRRRQRGITLIEISMVLALTAIFTAGIFGYLRSATANQKAEQAINEIAFIRNTIYELYKSQSSYANLTTQELATSRVVPDRMIERGNFLRHAFKGRLNVEPSGVSMFGDAFSIQLSQLPNDGCILVATKDFGRDVFRIDVAGGSGGSYDKALGPEEARLACGSEGETNASVTWYFR